MTREETGLKDYEIKDIKPLQSADGTQSGWVTIRYEKKNTLLTTKGCVSTQVDN